MTLPSNRSLVGPRITPDPGPGEEGFSRFLSAHGEDGPGGEESPWDALQPRHRPREADVGASVTADVKMSEFASMYLTRLGEWESSRRVARGGAMRLLKVGEGKEIYEIKGAVRSIRNRTMELDKTRNAAARR